MALIKQNAGYVRSFLMVGTADHITGQAAAAPKLNISKAGGALASTNAVVAEIGVGLYTMTLTSTDTNTIGDLLYHLTGTSADPADFTDQIVAFDPTDSVKLGLTVFPSNFASLGITSGGALSQTVTSGTVLDKTGYSLSQSFPANFASLGITSGGALSQPVTSGTVIGSVSVQSDLKKAVALSNLSFLMRDSTNHAPKTGATVSGNISKDGGAFAATANAPTELSNGFYLINLTASEMTASIISLRFTASGCDDTDLTLVTDP